MKLQIHWSDNAKHSFRAIISQIESKWSEKEVAKFVKKSFNVLETISNSPLIYQSTQYKDVRRAVITKQTSVLYKINDDFIEVLFFWDNRQEPLF